MEIGERRRGRKGGKRVGKEIRGLTRGSTLSVFCVFRGNHLLATLPSSPRRWRCRAFPILVAWLPIILVHIPPRRFIDTRYLCVRWRARYMQYLRKIAMKN